MMIETAPSQTGPGYAEDPYDSPGERAEGFFIGNIISKFTGESDGFCSTYREWHIFLAAVTTGLRAKTFENVPECPPLWKDERQYWDMPAMIANVIKCQWPGVVAVIGGLAGLKIAGITIPGVL